MIKYEHWFTIGFAVTCMVIFILFMSQGYGLKSSIVETIPALVITVVWWLVIEIITCPSDSI